MDNSLLAVRDINHKHIVVEDGRIYMTFYQELQLNQVGSKNLLKKSKTLNEKLYHMWVYLVKIAATMAFCFFFVSIFSILFGNERLVLE